MCSGADTAKIPKPCSKTNLTAQTRDRRARVVCLSSVITLVAL